MEQGRARELWATSLLHALLPTVEVLQVAVTFGLKWWSSHHPQWMRPADGAVAFSTGIDSNMYLSAELKDT